MSDNIEVQIPGPLRAQAEGLASVELAGCSVKEVLAALTARFPDLGQRLFQSEDALNRFINVYVNDEDIRFLDNLDTPVKPGDELAIVPAIAGG
jgi:molybdopterin converting factor small subunit